MKKVLFSRYTLIGYAVAATIAFVLVIVLPYVSFNWMNDDKYGAEAYWEITSYKADGCFDDYQNWNNSTVKSTGNSWNTLFIPGVGVEYNNPFRIMEQLADLNGDGLLDYFFSSNNYRYVSNMGNVARHFNCIYLNNGAGWDEVYKCVIIGEGHGVKRYYGDCAV